MDFDFLTLPKRRKWKCLARCAGEKEKRNLTIFAQRSLRPEDVLPEWETDDRRLGGTLEVERLLERGLRRFDVPFVKDEKGYCLTPIKRPSLSPAALQRRGLGDGCGSLSRCQQRASASYPSHSSRLSLNCWSKRPSIRSGKPLTVPRLRGGAWSTNVGLQADTVLFANPASHRDNMPGDHRRRCWLRNSALGFEARDDRRHRGPSGR